MSNGYPFGTPLDDFGTVGHHFGGQQWSAHFFGYFGNWDPGPLRNNHGQTWGKRGIAGTPLSATGHGGGYICICFLVFVCWEKIRYHACLRPGAGPRPRHRARKRERGQVRQREREGESC